MKKLFLELCIILALIACKDEKKEVAQATTKPVVKIGVLYPLSGDGASLGEAGKATANMFFEEFNRQPHKFDYEVIFEDNQNELSKQAILARKLIDANKADVLITAMSNFGAVVSPLAEQHKVMHVSVATDPTVANGKYNIITSSDPAGEAELLYTQLKKRGAENIDIIVMNATGSQTMLDYFQTKVKNGQDLKIGQIYHVNPDEKDFRTMLIKIKENNPDYIVAFLFMPVIDVFMKQYQESGISIPVTGIETFTYLQNREWAEGVWYVDAASATDDFITKYRAKTGKTSTDYAEYMDFALQMITFGYEGAGTTDKEKVINYIQDNSAGQITAVGQITTEPDGILNGQPVIKKIINGEPVIVKE